MNDEYPIVDSPLSQFFTAQGHTVEVLIYRGKDESGWQLEVVDSFGTSTVWDDPFPSDQAALDEVIRTITEEGIEALIDAPPKPSSLH